MKIKKTILAFVVLTMLGCHARLVKPGASREEMVRDLEYCYKLVHSYTYNPNTKYPSRFIGATVEIPNPDIYMEPCLRFHRGWDKVYE